MCYFPQEHLWCARGLMSQLEGMKPWWQTVALVVGAWERVLGRNTFLEFCSFVEWLAPISMASSYDSWMWGSLVF